MEAVHAYCVSVCSPLPALGGRPPLSALPRSRQTHPPTALRCSMGSPSWDIFLTIVIASTGERVRGQAWRRWRYSHSYLFVLAAFGGAYMSLESTCRGEPPRPRVIIHGLAAGIGFFVSCSIYVFGNTGDRIATLESLFQESGLLSRAIKDGRGTPVLGDGGMRSGEMRPSRGM